MLTGVLVDVSGSMKNSLQLNVKPTDEYTTRAQSIFSTITSIAEREVDFQGNQEMFALAFGLHSVATCDLFGLLNYVKALNNQSAVDGYKSLTDLLAQHGAPRAGEYVKQHLTEREARFLFSYYSQDINGLSEVIENLPSICKYDDPITNTAYRGGTFIQNIGSFFGLCEDPGEKEKELTRNQANHAIERAKTKIGERNLARLKAMSTPKNYTFKSVIDLLKEIGGKSSTHLHSAQESFSAKQLSNLVDSIEPFIYGYTPMCQALTLALDAFRSSTYNRKVLFLLSDGESTDGDPTRFAQQLRESDVLVFVCLLTSENILHPRRLYYDQDPTWTRAQCIMFELSSTVENSHPAMSILLEQRWELPVSGHSRLFVQANHPGVVKEFSNLVRNMAENNNALLNIFGRVSLDMYINISNSTFEPKLQIGGTCYANAVAAVIHLATRRIEGRQGGYPNFEEIRRVLIEEYGQNGANTEQVLHKYCPVYRLHYKQDHELGARQAINARRPVIATFRLYKQQWEAFGRYYQSNRQGILEIKDLGIHTSLTEEGGHAVVLIKCDPQSLTFMNSWGTDFADNGFFKVRNEAVLNLKFYDVYWTLEDLYPSEITAFESKSKNVGRTIAQKLPESIKNLPYQCPKCHQCSPAITFTGHLLEATCPRCNQTFKPTPLGIMLNSYT